MRGVRTPKMTYGRRPGRRLMEGLIRKRIAQLSRIQACGDTLESCHDLFQQRQPTRRILQCRVGTAVGAGGRHGGHRAWDHARRTRGSRNPCAGPLASCGAIRAVSRRQLHRPSSSAWSQQTYLHFGSPIDRRGSRLGKNPVALVSTGPPGRPSRIQRVRAGP